MSSARLAFSVASAVVAAAFGVSHAVPRMVVAEGFIGNEGYYCPGSVMGLHNLHMAVGDSMAPLFYHTYGTDAFEVPGCDERFEYYGGGETPQVWFDGTIQNSGGDHTTPINYWPEFSQRKVIPSPVTMAIELEEYDPGVGAGTVRTKVTNVSGSDVTGCIHLNTTGDDTAYAWQNQAYLYYTVLEVDFGDNTCFYLMPGESAEAVDQVFTLDTGWRSKSCTVVGFFQDPETKHIHQGALLHGITNSVQQDLAGDEIQLDWGTVFMASEYWIYGGIDAPFFLPDLGPNHVNRVGVVQPPTTNWSTTMGVNNPDDNYTFMVLAVNPQSQVMWQSLRLGEFEFEADVTPR